VFIKGSGAKLVTETSLKNRIRRTDAKVEPLYLRYYVSFASRTNHTTDLLSTALQRLHHNSRGQTHEKLGRRHLDAITVCSPADLS